VFRGFSGRELYRTLSHYRHLDNVAATQIQAAFRGSLVLGWRDIRLNKVGADCVTTTLLLLLLLLPLHCYHNGQLTSSTRWARSCSAARRSSYRRGRWTWRRARRSVSRARSTTRRATRRRTMRTRRGSS
jgi:hypothetical protein